MIGWTRRGPRTATFLGIPLCRADYRNLQLGIALEELSGYNPGMAATGRDVKLHQAAPICSQVAGSFEYADHPTSIAKPRALT